MKNKISSAQLLKKFFIIGTLLSSCYIAQALTVSPARLEINVDPGMVSENEFTVINEQDAEQTFYTSIENFEAQGESGTPNFTPTKDGLAAWVKVAESVTLKKGEKVKIPFTVNVPTDADAGGHFAAIFLSTIPPSTNAGEVAVGAKIGMLMLVRVSGEIKEDGGVRSFLLKNGGHFSTTLPVDFVYRFNNNGNDRAKPEGTINIRNTFGITTESLNANEREGNVLPNSVRRFEVRWGKEDALPASASFFSFVKYEMRNFAFGIYFANLDLTFGLTGKTNSSLYFVIFPWHLFIIVLLIAGIIYLALSFALKRYNQFIIKQARLMNAGSGDDHDKPHKKKK
jgi:hypothetical protein